MLAHVFTVVGLLLMLVSSQMAKSGSAIRNSWRGITPLRSSAEDVARLVSPELGRSDTNGPFQVEGGEVTFSFLTPSLAKIYRAPRSMVGKVFTIYYRPSEPMWRTDLTLGRGFKRCVEERDRMFYYFISDSGVAYRFLRDGDQLETIIYQPSRAEVRSLAVSTECVF